MKSPVTLTSRESRILLNLYYLCTYLEQYTHSGIFAPQNSQIDISTSCSALKYSQIVTNTTLFWIWWKIYKFQSFYFSMLLFTFSFSKEERWIGYRGWNVTLYFLTDYRGLLKLKFEILKIRLWHEFTTSYFNQKLYLIHRYVQ